MQPSGFILLLSALPYLSTVTASDIRGDHDYNRYHRRKPEIVSPTATIVAATTSAPPQASYTNTVGAGSNCGVVGSINYVCGDGYECISSWYSETASICNQIGQPAPTTASGAYVIIGLYVYQPRQPVPLLLHRALAYVLFLFQQVAVARDQPGPQLPPARVLIGRYAHWLNRLLLALPLLLPSLQLEPRVTAPFRQLVAAQVRHSPQLPKVHVLIGRYAYRPRQSQLPLPRLRLQRYQRAIVLFQQVAAAQAQSRARLP
ncbi:hypothetical protein M422DRAFT_255858 [Sphaerobolus stellatus SS14]|uniref:Uncharacterized protein n=1 Tax=Sphaerobolus stellatus (strain SS14) TaxID=990650 RepID=A0A0C9VHW9_SPHS4|nr:hypothetical protein M422DRAFT_255858 [Sphaerobolus stellatus SS14]